ncbi:sigma-70 family RNA polymerase sigma factor [Paenibacillus eucommiae]|uniref:RNA polymerase sigma factor (Sigma-70 family) n=1 Tax=Paenibacillus eucommiae TaxID=1355755 RepID=A0ABS4IQM9_9BACL|nr:sigma-70 family RNA polymerase sigma factor [Paenibacillus eucommiae]MBP1989880.1 RNA polymerase sigma factor (sigma-70 family) [Paenibacillus eucommiae]
MTEEELKDWISKTNRGDKESFRVLYKQTICHVYKTISFLIHNKQDVYDVVSEVYTEVFKSLPKYNFDKPFRTWLNGLIVRQTSNWNRKIWSRSRLYDRSQLLELVEHAPDSEQIHLQKEHNNELVSRIHKLSYKHSVVIVLRYYQDCSFEEISKILKIPVGTVRSRHHIALEKLRSQGNYIMDDDIKAPSTNHFNRKPLKLEFKRVAEQLERPVDLDIQIEHQFTSFYFKGFEFEIASSPSPIMSQYQRDRFEDVRTNVRNQLSMGESAFVYISDLDNELFVFPTLGLTRVNNSLFYLDMNEWRELISIDYSGIKLPSTMPDGFTFIRAETESKGAVTYENQIKYYTLLKERALKTNGGISWQKSVPEDDSFLNVTPHLIYSNYHMDQIEVCYMLLMDGAIRTIPGTNPEKINVAGLKCNVYYLSSNEKKCISWIEQINGKIYAYDVFTRSPNVTKNDLLFVVAKMK